MQLIPSPCQASHLTPVPTPSSLLSPLTASQIGEGGTYAWSLGGIDPSTSLSLYFDVAAKDTQSAQPGKRHHLQLITYYQHSSGRYRMRVTTSAGMWNGGDPNSLGSLAAGFDQETAAVMIARIAVNRTESEEAADILRWLDRSLIRLCSKFAEYTKDDPSSFRLSPNLSLFPQFMFHLRRSQFMQVCVARWRGSRIVGEGTPHV